ncbi:MAG: TonB-dependent receptor plug domain-containing protein, partial [Candidatus Latescibacteria bacterium]|nr:TonB-dependent receptor plug domain-containing protein [Candidatus Latescibacterota bacterium]
SLKAVTLKDLPALGEADLLRSLQLLPGIQAASDISSGLYVRGGGPDQTKILLDQIPLYNPSHAFGFFSTFNPDAIKELSLYKSAYPAKYGGNLGAVLDVANRDGNRNNVQATGGISVIAARTTLEGPVRNGSWMISGRRTYLEPLLNAIRTDSNNIPSYYFYDLNAKINQDLSPSDKFVVSGYFGRDDLNFDLDTGSFVKIRWGNAAVTGKWTHIFSPTLFGNFLVAGSEYVSRTSLSFFETPFSFRNSVRDLTIKGDLDYFASSNHALTMGFLGTRYDFSFQQNFNQQETRDLKLKPYLLSFYGQDQWQALPTTTVRLGLRGNHFSEQGGLDLEPRIAVSHSLSENVRMKLGGGLYHQYLQLITTEGFSGGDFWFPLDSTVSPAQAWQSVLGVAWSPTEQYQLSVETYFSRLNNLVVFDGNQSEDGEASQSDDLFITEGSGYATGMEFFLQRRTGAFTGWIGYTLGWTRRRFSELNQGRSFHPKYDRRHDVSFVAKYKTGRWTFGSNYVYGTGQVFTPASARYALRSPATGILPRDDFILPGGRNTARLLDYHRMDLNITRDLNIFGLRSQFYLQIFNLYSRRNEWFIQYDTNNPNTEPEVVKMLPVIPTIGLNFKF